MATRCCWPPENWPGRSRSRPPRPTCSSCQAARRRASSRRAADEQGDGHVLGHGQRRHQIEGLEHEADVFPPEAHALAGRKPAYVLAEKLAGAAVLVEDAGNDGNERGLAAARRPDEHEQFAGGNAQVDAGRARVLVSPEP